MPKNYIDVSNINLVIRNCRFLPEFVQADLLKPQSCSDFETLTTLEADPDRTLVTLQGFPPTSQVSFGLPGIRWVLLAGNFPGD